MKFRKRYAASVLSSAIKRVWIITRAVIGLALLGGAVVGARHVWQHSQALAVRAVDVSARLPADLKQAPPVARGANILAIKPREIESAVLRAHPELATVDVRRHLDRRVSIDGRYRAPVALVPKDKAADAVDATGALFTLAPENGPTDGLPTLHADGADGRKVAVDALVAWKEKWPAFYALVADVETDRMRPLRVRLKNGATVEWGTTGAPERAARVLKLLQRFVPKGPSATVRFVDGDRLVVDANWSAVETAEKGGDDRVKT